MPEPLGYVLSGATTVRAVVELTRRGEERLSEGMLIVIEGPRGSLLGRVDQISVYNEFYRPGDAWSPARREGWTPPRQLSRYSVAEVTIIGRMGKGIEEARWPPEPGDPVYGFDETEHGLSALYGVEQGEPGVIWYGSLLGYKNLPLALNVEALTMHLGVFGETGSGKSYGFGYLLELLSRIPIGDEMTEALPAIIVDANGDYIDYWLDMIKGKRLGRYRCIWRLVSSKSSVRYKPYARPYTIDLEVFTARELAEFIVAYKSGGWELNELQVAGLERVIGELEAEGYSHTVLLTERIDMVYDRIDRMVRERRMHHQTAKAIKMAVEKFHKDLVKEQAIIARNPTINREFIDQLVSSPSMAILDFSAEGSPGTPLAVRQLIVAYLSRLLYTVFTEYKVRGSDAYILYALEEAQNYAPNQRRYPVPWSLARDYLALIATQGRKFGICLAVISQRPVYVDPVIVSMINTFIIHRLSAEDVEYIDKVSGGLPAPIKRRLTILPRGTALVTGQANMLKTPVLVKVGERSTSHRIGYTGIIDTLRRINKLGA